MENAVCKYCWSQFQRKILQLHPLHLLCICCFGQLPNEQIGKVYVGTWFLKRCIPRTKNRGFFFIYSQSWSSHVMGHI